MEVCFGVTPTETFPLFTPNDEYFEEMVEIFRVMRITEDKQMEVNEASCESSNEVKSTLLNRKVCIKVRASARKRLSEFSRLTTGKKYKKDPADKMLQDARNKMIGCAPRKKVVRKLKM